MRSIITTLIGLIILSGAVDLQAQTQKSRKATQNATEDATYNVNAVKYHASQGDAAALNQLGVWYYTGKNVPRDVDKAFSLWCQAALLQNAKAIANLGVCYQYGTGVAPDSLSALRLYLAAIEAGQDDLLAQRKANVGKNAFDGILIGLCYEKGIGASIDYAEAAKAYAAAADLGSKDAYAPAALMFRKSGNNDKAIDYAKKGAEMGIPQAQFYAGQFILDTDINTLRAPLALEYLDKAAENGNIDAANYLAELNFNGQYDLMPKSARIVQWLEAAQDRGNARAMFNLATAYKSGIGVDRDFDKAIALYDKAIAAGLDEDYNAMLNDSRTKSHDYFDNYIDALAYIESGDFKAAESQAKVMQKAKLPEAKLIQALIMADPRNPKQNIKKAEKELKKLSSKYPRAAAALEGL